MKSITRAQSGHYVKNSDEIYKIAKEILDYQSLSKPVRLIGITGSNLTDKAYIQLSFNNSDLAENNVLGNTIFNIKQKFGRGTLKTAKEIAAEAHLADEYKKFKKMK